MDWFLYDNGLLHERANIDGKRARALMDVNLDEAKPEITCLN